MFQGTLKGEFGRKLGRSNRSKFQGDNIHQKEKKRGGGAKDINNQLEKKKKCKRPIII